MQTNQPASHQNGTAPAPVSTLRDYFEQRNRTRKHPLTADELGRCHLFEITGYANDPVLPKGTIVTAVEKKNDEWSKVTGDCLLSLHGAVNCLVVGRVRSITNRFFRVRFHNPALADCRLKRLDVVAVYKIVSISLNWEW